MEVRVRQHRLPSLIRHLLPDHHVYVRSGPSSRYVVLAWPWQVGVGAAFLGLVLWTALASSGWLASQLEVREQRREIARLAQVNRQLEALVASAALPGPADVHPDAAARLVVDLEEIKTGQRLALRLAAAPSLETGQPWRAPRSGSVEDGAIDSRLVAGLLPAALDVGFNLERRDWLYDRLTRHLVANPAHAAEMIRLRAELRAARARLVSLETVGGSER
jgi:hypothetical protein